MNTAKRLSNAYDFDHGKIAKAIADHRAEEYLELNIGKKAGHKYWVFPDFSVLVEDPNGFMYPDSYDWVYDELVTARFECGDLNIDEWAEEMGKGVDRIFY